MWYRKYNALRQVFAGPEGLIDEMIRECRSPQHVRAAATWLRSHIGPKGNNFLPTSFALIKFLLHHFSRLELCLQCLLLIICVLQNVLVKCQKTKFALLAQHERQGGQRGRAWI